ncbi:MAG: hypothetical protein ACRC46_11310 [Thermoguttaceae bacterium]
MAAFLILIFIFFAIIFTVCVDFNRHTSEQEAVPPSDAPNPPALPASVPSLQSSPFTAAMPQMAPPVSAPAQSSDTLPTAKALDSYCQRYSVSAVAMTLLSLVLNVMPSIPVVVLLFVNFAIWAVCWCLLVYNLWKLVPAGIARTTPNKAVGFTMIPFYSYYWVFVSVLGLCKDMNTTLRQYGVRHRVNEGLGMIYCLCFVGCAIPFAGVLLSMVGVVVGIILFRSLVDGSIALLEQMKQSVSTPVSEDNPLDAPVPATNNPFTAPAPSGHCADCHVETKKGEFLAYCLPANMRRGKECLCPNCVEKYTIPCPKCRFDWRVNVEKGLFDCPMCNLTQTVGCADISHVLCQSEAFLSRIPQVSSKEDIVMVVGAIYRRGHPHYLDPMGGFLVLTNTGCYFLGPIDSDITEKGHRDIFMPFASITTASALSDGVHSQKNKSHQNLSEGLATVAKVAHSAARTIPIVGSFVSQGRASNNPPPKNRLTIASRNKEVGRLTVAFDIIDVSNEQIEKTAVEFRKRLFSFGSQFDVGKKPEAAQQATAPQPVGEKFRVFRAGKLLGMITPQEIEAKCADKTLQQTDFVLLPLETFLATIAVPDKPFQLFRDGKRIDQYTLQQINELHENGQTQQIDHVLLPMQVFLERKTF